MMCTSTCTSNDLDVHDVHDLHVRGVLYVNVNLVWRTLNIQYRYIHAIETSATGTCTCEYM